MKATFFSSVSYKFFAALMIVLLAVSALPVMPAMAAVGTPPTFYHAPSGTTGPFTITNATFACAGTNRLLVAVVTAEYTNAGFRAIAVTATKGAGVNFTQAVATGPANTRTGVWIGYLTEAQLTANANSVVITENTTGTWQGSDVYLYCLTGVDQTTPIVPGGTFQTASDANTQTWTFTNVPAVNTGMMIYAAGSNGNVAMTQPAGYTEAFDINSGGNIQSSTGYKASAAATESGTITLTGAPGDRYAAAVISVNPAAVAPTVTTQAVTAITTTTATGNGNITALGSPNPTQYGVVWDTAANPTVALATKTAQGAIAVTGAFTSSITGLTPGTLYHVRAYATNAAGTSYGADVTFTALLAPTVTTQAVTAITTTTATGNGNITALGVPNPTQYGVVWDTVANPTVALATKTAQGAIAVTGAFTSSITGLTPGTLYHVRAYATNAAGTSYGADVTFTALLVPTVTTQAVTAITTTTATGNGNLTALGVPNPTAYGVVWSTALNPTTADSVSDLGAAAATGAFTAPITGLSPNTLYHVRAYATNTAGTVYGADVTFTTLPLAPIVTTQAVTAITGTTATGNGNLTVLGVPNPTAYGVVWSLVANPTTADNVSDLGAAAATGAFTAPITGLTAGTLYHIRAFATNTAGTVYGADVTFTTLLAPTVTTQAVTAITGTTATGNGNLTALGVPNPTAHGVVWSTALNPTTADSVSDLGAAAATGAFTAPITGLTAGTLYHVRAFATNTAGTAYGADVTFTTLLAPTVTTQAVTAIAGTTATGNGDLTVLGVPNPTAYGVVWSLVANPTTADNVSDLGAAAATGAFTAPITGLTAGTLYHVRAFATNTSGTVYGADVTFTTVLAPTVTTQAVSAITGTTATGNGNLTVLGVPNPTAYGVVWSTALNPTTADSVSNLGAVAATGAFTAPISGLTAGTLYHVRAFATNTAGTVYGTDVTFTTLLAPTVTTQAVTAISGTTATGNGDLTVLGAPNPTAYGVVWSTALNPTTADSVSDLGAAAATGAFTAPITGLTTGTLYHVRAFATNTSGTVYGADVTFTTTLAPTVTTQAVSAVGITSATGNGSITDLGVPNPTAYGVVWGTALNPTTADSVNDLGAAAATGAFTAPITGLTGGTLYHVRAFATNTAGTAYGADVTFTTVAAGNPTVTSTTLTASYTNTGPGSFIATFSKAVDDPAGNTGIDDVTNPANFLLINKGTNGVANTASCAGGVVADDTQITVMSVIYNPATFQAKVTLAGSLPVGSYRLFICGTTSIVDLAGNPLNGGTDYTFDFVVQVPATVPTIAPATQSTVVTALPATGFRQDKATILPLQPADKAYASTDLWLEIPKLGVKMSVVGVPQTKDGWDVTWLNKDAGWLHNSAYPTWSGNSVITAHVWDALNKPGPFAQLKSLKYGDQVKIHAFGQVYTYEIRASQTVLPSNLTAVFKHEDRSWVTLVTCEDYKEQSGMYSYRRMIRAVLISVTKEK